MKSKFSKRDKLAPFCLTIAALFALNVVAPNFAVQGTESAFSDKASSKITVAAQQWIVPSLEAFPSDYRNINVNWQKAGSYTNYVLQYSLNSNFSNATSLNVTGITRAISGLSAETTYYFRIQAAGAPGTPNGSWSKTASAKTPAQAPTTQTIFHETPDPHGLSLDSKNNLWTTNYNNDLVRKISPTGVVTDIGPVIPGSHPRGISVVNDTTAVLVRSYSDSVNSPTTGIYTINSSGQEVQRAQFYRPYGVVYDSRRNKVFVSHERYLSECDYATWVCTKVMEQPANNIGHLSITPDGSKVVMGGGNNNVISVYEIATQTRKVLVNTTGLDARGATALGDNDYLATSWKTGDVFRIQVDPNSGEVSVQTVITGGSQPRMMAYVPASNTLYIGMSSVSPQVPGIFKYVNLIR